MSLATRCLVFASAALEADALLLKTTQCKGCSGDSAKGDDGKDICQLKKAMEGVADGKEITVTKKAAGKTIAVTLAKEDNKPEPKETIYSCKTQEKCTKDGKIASTEEEKESADTKQVTTKEVDGALKGKIKGGTTIEELCKGDAAAGGTDVKDQCALAKIFNDADTAAKKDKITAEADGTTGNIKVKNDGADQGVFSCDKVEKCDKATGEKKESGGDAADNTDQDKIKTACENAKNAKAF